MNAEEMKHRTRGFALEIARFTLMLPDNLPNSVYKRQLVRASSSVGANYRASRRAKSKADFINKLKIVEEELDESLFFLELIGALNENYKERINILYQEGDVLLRIIVSSILSARK
ncbi:MAG TPA: four helix bundle protein [Chitinophagaceae bacterium]|nr:four helix bundle protein [Chitinophagaceae bacterium]